MRTYRGSIGAALLVLAIGASACGANDADTAAPQEEDGVEEDAAAPGDFDDVEPRTFDVAKQLGPEGFRSELLQWWADEITARTDDTMEFEFYWSESLLDATDMIDGVSAGIADIAVGTSSYEPARTPLFQVVDLPYNYEDPYCSATVTPRLIEEDPGLSQEFEQNNMVALNGYFSGTWHDLANEEITSIDQLSGQRVRVFSSAGAMWMEELGMSPVFMTLGELYEALDRGVIDRANLTSYLTVALSLYETISHYAEFEGSGGASGYLMFMNADLWDELPAQVQDVFREVGAEHNERIARELIELEPEWRQTIEDEGVTVYDLPDDVQDEFRAAGERAIERWLDEMEGEGHPVRETYENHQAFTEECMQEIDEQGYPWER